MWKTDLNDSKKFKGFSLGEVTRIAQGDRIEHCGDG